MPKLVAEVTPIVVRDFEQAVLDTKGVQMIYPQREAGKFWGPALKIFTIKQLNPFIRARTLSIQPTERQNCA